ncbi:MAG: acetate--CoA ligase [Nanoarchaeota archaeon]
MDNNLSISSMMKEDRIFPPPEHISRDALVRSMDQYEALYHESIADPHGFWGRMSNELDWFQRPREVFNFTQKPFVNWFRGGKINVSYNCLDRHLNTWRANKAALIWEGERPGESKTFTFKELHYEVSKFSNVLKSLGVQRGDRVCVYMPMIPELAITLLACARIGAVHSVVFGGFSVDSLRTRVEDCDAKVLVTADGSFRSGKTYPLKSNADQAIDLLPVQNVIVVQRTKCDVEWKQGRDLWWHELMENPDLPIHCDAEWLDSEESLFILYTSGTTGKPKGLLHTTAGYLMYTYLTFKYVFDVKDTDTYWCTADIGWITGHSYILYGPLANGATTLMFEGVPTFPKPDRFWEIVEKYKVSLFYTAPTAIRSMAQHGDAWPNKHDLSSLRILGSVGEPINPEAWMWYYTVIGKGRCPIVDTYWQTETGGFLLTPLPGATPLKPGSATRPFFGVVPAILKEDGSEAGIDEGGYLVIRGSWPGIARTVWKDPDRYKETYFGKFDGSVYVTGDGARKDKDGYYWVMGRLDDVLKISGHRIGTAEVESALVSHASVAEAAVVPVPHEIKGSAIYAFVTLKEGYIGSDSLVRDLREQVSHEMGPIAKPDKIQFAPSLPKTRSGKIMRRILRKIACGEQDVGDTTTLADPSVVEDLIQHRV